jgi:uncharacterized membrane protein
VASLARAAASVEASWAVVHTVYALSTFGSTIRIRTEASTSTVTIRRGRSTSPTSVHDRHDLSGRRYRDQRTRIRGYVLRQSLLAYVFGAVILAATINLLAGLAK